MPQVDVRPYGVDVRVSERQATFEARRAGLMPGMAVRVTQVWSTHYAARLGEIAMVRRVTAEDGAPSYTAGVVENPEWAPSQFAAYAVEPVTDENDIPANVASGSLTWRTSRAPATGERVVVVCGPPDTAGLYGTLQETNAAFISPFLVELDEPVRDANVFRVYDVRPLTDEEIDAETDEDDEVERVDRTNGQMVPVQDLNEMRERAERAELALQNFKDMVRERMIAEAEAREWCGEFDDILVEFGLDPRDSKRRWAMRLIVEYTVEATRDSQVEPDGDFVRNSLQLQSTPTLDSDWEDVDVTHESTVVEDIEEVDL